MLLMSPPIGEHLQVGDQNEFNREQLVQKADVMEVRNFSIKSFPDWNDDETMEAKAFLNSKNLHVGELAPFYLGRYLGSQDKALHKEALESFRNQLRIGSAVGAQCIGFGWGKEFSSPNPQIWSKETWNHRIAGVADLAKEAEEFGVDVAGHPLYFSPLCSLQRYKEMLDAVASPRLKVLIDIVNLSLPHMLFNTTDFVNQVFDELGEHIVSLHAKDIKIAGAGLGPCPKTEKGMSLIHLDEVPPGEGVMDYATILLRLNQLDHDVTIHVEHFNYEDTITAQQYIRSVARRVGVNLN